MERIGFAVSNIFLTFNRFYKLVVFAFFVEIFCFVCRFNL